MEKPNYIDKNAEWYDDGFTLKEQSEFKNQYRESKPKIHLTESFVIKSADTLISKLRQELAAANAYIEELEDGINCKELKRNYEILLKENANLKTKNNKLEYQYKNILKKYSNDMSTILSVDEKYLSQKEQIEKLTEEVSNLKNIRDKLIYQLNLNKAI